MIKRAPSFLASFLLIVAMAGTSAVASPGQASDQERLDALKAEAARLGAVIRRSEQQGQVYQRDVDELGDVQTYVELIESGASAETERAYEKMTRALFDVRRRLQPYSLSTFENLEDAMAALDDIELEFCNHPNPIIGEACARGVASLEARLNESSDGTGYASNESPPAEWDVWHVKSKAVK